MAAAALAGSVWFAATPAHAQIAAREFRLDARTIMDRAAPVRRSSYALPALTNWHPDASDGLMRSWELDGGMRVGFGRFAVTPIARPRSNLERELMPTERRPSAVAGAGMRIPF